MTPEELLEQAAQLIERDGWCRDEYVAPDGSHCVLGALYEVTGVDPDAEHDLPEGDVARRRCVRALGVEAHARGVLSTFVWNDTRCRSGKEAAAFLRAAKARL